MARGRVWAVPAAIALLVAGCQQARPPTRPGPSAVASPTHAPSPDRSRSSSAPPTASASPPRPTRAGSTAARSTPAARPSPAGLPLPFDTGAATQVITVTAPSAGATRASLQAWVRTGGSWHRLGDPVPAWLGYAGLTSHAREGYSGTPIGSFGLTHAFGNAADPGTRLPYRQVGPDDWWVGDTASRYYNTHQNCPAASCPFDTAASENLHQAGWVYGYAVVIDYNSAPVVAGRGSAFFLHVTENHPTRAACRSPRPHWCRSCAGSIRPGSRGS